MVDMSSLNPALTGLPVVASLGGLIWRGWQRERRTRRAASSPDDAFAQALEQERRRRAEAGQGAATLRSEAEPWQRGQGSGQIALAAVGSAAAGQLPGICEGFVRASADPFLGAILLAEPDAMSRTACLADLPSACRERVVPVPLSLLPGGLLGRTVQEGWELRKYWLADLQDRCDQWLTRLRHTKPVCLLVLVSPGGSASLGWPAIQRFKQEYDQAEVYVVLVLDDKTERREVNIPALLDLYGQDELVSGFLVLDNRRSSQLFDQALALLLPSLVVAPWIDPRPKSGFNVLADVFRRHRVATLRAWVGALPVTYSPSFQDTLPEVYYTDLSFAQAQALRGIEQVLSQPDLQSLPLEAAIRPHFIYVVAPIRPDPDYRRLAERVQASPIPGVSFDTPLNFASIGHPLRPTSQQAPLMVVSLVPIPSGLAGVRHLASGQQEDTTHDLSLPPWPLNPTTTEASVANGRHRQ